MELAKQENALGLMSYDLGDMLPDINEGEAMPFDITSEYWSPGQVGETKRLWFRGLEISKSPDPNTGEELEALHVLFIEVAEDGTQLTIKNRSWKMVDAFQNIPSGTAWQITYLGKQTARNGNQSDNWRIQPIKFRQEAYQNAPVDLEGISIGDE